MKVREVTASADVPAPATVVWRVLTDWSHQGEWMLGTRVTVVSGDGQSVGTRLFGFTGIADIGFLDELEIVEWTPPRLCRARHLGTLLRGSATFTVDPHPGGSTVTWTESLETPAGRLGPVLAWGMRRSLRRLASRPW